MSYSVTLLSAARLAILRISGSITGFIQTPKIINPKPNNVNTTTLVIKISGTMPPTVSRNASIA